MSIKVFDKEFDKVISSVFALAKTDFKYAIEVLVPMIDKYQEQRYILKSKLYEKLEQDLEKGCIMPPLTIAFKYEDILSIQEMNDTQLEEFITNKMSKGFILDGIQRLNTLKRIHSKGILLDIPIYLNILVCDTMDKLLYRMITLNNGQKPMSARHQIEILADSIYDFDALNIKIISEKEQKAITKQIFNDEMTFTKENIIKAYMAYISNSINFDNQKIIADKLDELITNKIMESYIPDRQINFAQVIELVSKNSEDINSYKWFSNINNMIGFCSAIAHTYSTVAISSCEEFAQSVFNFEEAFKDINKSKINVGTARRKAARALIENYTNWKNMSIANMIDEISMTI